MKQKLTYDDVKLNGKVIMARSSKESPNHIGEIVGIENFASLAGINEPVFCVKFRDFRAYFGLKYILKHYVKE